MDTQMNIQRLKKTLVMIESLSHTLFLVSKQKEVGLSEAIFNKLQSTLFHLKHNYTMLRLYKLPDVLSDVDCFKHLRLTVQKVEYFLQTYDISKRLKRNLRITEARSLNELYGLEKIASIIRQALILPVRLPHLFIGARQPWRSILLYGPPGTGKTALAAAAAKECNANFVAYSAADLLSHWVGGSEKLIRDMFQGASSDSSNPQRKPKGRTLLFLDEIDALCGIRGADGESEVARRIKTEFLIRMQSVDPSSLLIVAATNLPWELDAAFRRRFDRLLYVGLPDEKARRAILESSLFGLPHTLPEEAIDALAKQLEGYSGSDIKHLSQHAAMAPIARLDSASFLCQARDGYYYPIGTSQEALNSKTLSFHEVPPNEIGVPPITSEDFVEAIMSYPRTTQDEDLRKFVQWQNNQK